MVVLRSIVLVLIYSCLIRSTCAHNSSPLPHFPNRLWAYYSMPGHYVLEGLLASQYHQDYTVIEPWTGSPYWFRNRDDCIAEGVIPPDYEGVLPEECWGTAEEWIDVSFGGAFTWEHVPLNVIYCLAILIIAKVVSYWALRNLDYLSK